MTARTITILNTSIVKSTQEKSSVRHLNIGNTVIYRPFKVPLANILAKL